MILGLRTFRRFIPRINQIAALANETSPYSCMMRVRITWFHTCAGWSCRQLHHENNSWIQIGRYEGPLWNWRWLSSQKSSGAGFSWRYLNSCSSIHSSCVPALLTEVRGTFSGAYAVSSILVAFFSLERYQNIFTWIILPWQKQKLRGNSLEDLHLETKIIPKRRWAQTEP